MVAEVKEKTKVLMGKYPEITTAIRLCEEHKMVNWHLMVYYITETNRSLESLIQNGTEKIDSVTGRCAFRDWIAKQELLVFRREIQHPQFLEYAKSKIVDAKLEKPYQG